MAEPFLEATNVALATATRQMLFAAEAKNQELVARNHPVAVVRSIDNVVAAADAAYTVYQVARLGQVMARQASRISYRYSYLDDVVKFAIETLIARSPVGSRGDPHPGLYRNSHRVFVDGRSVNDMSGWRPGQVVHISNSVPYARKIEAGHMQLSVPAHVYEEATDIVVGRYGNIANVRFVFMPVRPGEVADWAATTSQQREGRRMSEKVRAEWLVRQPAMEIRTR